MVDSIEQKTLQEGPHLTRQQRRALERQAKKSPIGPGRVLSAEQAAQTHDIVSQIDALSEKNRGLNLAEVSEQDRNQAVLLSAQLYQLARPSSRFSVEELVSSVDFKDGIPEELYQPHLGHIREWQAESYDPGSGQIFIWMGTAGFLNESYDPKIEPYIVRYHTPVSMLVQILSHAFHHKGAQDPESHNTGFYQRSFNEIVTEYLRVEADKRAGLKVVSRYPNITERIPLLQKVLVANGISEQQLFEFYTSCDDIGLACLLAAKKFPNEYRRFKSKPMNLNEDDRDTLILMRSGIQIIRNVEHGELGSSR